MASGRDVLSKWLSMRFITAWGNVSWTMRKVLTLACKKCQ